jgi:hypothetical protein
MQLELNATQLNFIWIQMHWMKFIFNSIHVQLSLDWIESNSIQ